MYQYEDIIKQLLYGRNYKTVGEQLRCSCPFGTHEDKNPSFNISMEKGCFLCHACGARGSISNFGAEMTGVSTKEAWQEIKSVTGVDDDDNYTSQNKLPYSMEDYSREKYIDIEYLKIWGIEDSSNGNSIKIPYFDIEGNFIAYRHRNNPESEVRFWWEGGSSSIYGLNYLNRFNNAYVIMVERRIRLPFVVVI